MLGALGTWFPATLSGRLCSWSTPRRLGSEQLSTGQGCTASVAAMELPLPPALHSEPAVQLGEHRRLQSQGSICRTCLLTWGEALPCRGSCSQALSWEEGLGPDPSCPAGTPLRGHLCPAVSGQSLAEPLWCLHVGLRLSLQILSSTGLISINLPQSQACHRVCSPKDPNWPCWGGPTRVRAETSPRDPSQPPLQPLLGLEGRGWRFQKDTRWGWAL